ncbi:diguanylate cyclase [Eubacterium sp. 1001713B170207_170306_E7]|uniref:GGDEF domain-containing response regulator n=1 Tax=Eubacterium sp. 1001713B170207_170306_E7 TaxID=2787097 RepID=UPI001897DF38|nr:diguanylate cyclase [Eubacterium sp. 1001713B170207_170306_E7]
MRQSILIVDDMEQNRKILGMMFQDTFEILEAENGYEAMCCIHKNQDMLAAVLLDVVMPVMDGFEVLEHLQDEALTEVLPVVLITAEEPGMAARRGYALGALDILTKPFDPVVIKRRVSNIIELGSRKKEFKKLKNEAENDVLTGIFNRKAMEDRIGTMLCNPETRCGALCFIDVDNFKTINDSFGHLYGDEVLKRMAENLKSCALPGDAVGRIGGDEFMIFFRNYPSEEQLEQKIANICENFRRYTAGGQITGSIGVARYPEDGDGYGVLFSKADQALYHLKRSGKDGYQFYSKDCSSLPFQSVLTCVDDEVE